MKMGDKCEKPEGNPTTDLVNDAEPSAPENFQPPVVEIVNEKGEQLLEAEDIQKPKVPVSLPDVEILGAQKYESEPGRAYEYAYQRGYGQTPYYQQQRVGGQSIYVQGRPPPEPANVARTPPYRLRNDDYDYHRNSSIFSMSFDNMAIRNRFVQRVYTILTVQLIYTCCFIALCIFEENVKYFMQRNAILVLVAAIVEIVILFSLTCCVSARRNFPLNFFLLGLFTVAFAYIMAFISTTYSTYIVITSMAITAGICLLVSIFACQTSCDVTGWGMYLCIIGVVVAIFGFVAILVAMLTGSRTMFLIYAGIIAVLFSMYLMYDTQMIMGGHRIELSPEEYIFGALCLYVDIMEIFWAILTLIGITRG